MQTMGDPAGILLTLMNIVLAMLAYVPCQTSIDEYCISNVSICAMPNFN